MVFSLNELEKPSTNDLIKLRYGGAECSADIQKSGPVRSGLLKLRSSQGTLCRCNGCWCQMRKVLERIFYAICLGIFILKRFRCYRLNKDCQPIHTVRKRRAVNKPSAPSTAKLEEKLDGLFKLLQSTTESTASASTAPTSTQPSPESLQSDVASPKATEDFVPRALQHLNWNRPRMDGLHLKTAADAAYVTSGTRSTIYHCPESSPTSGLEPSLDEAEEFLKSFRLHMAPWFPIIIVPESTTAQELRRYRPFLWLCIMSVTSKSTVQQKALGKEVKITLGRELLVEGKNNIDLLLGIIVFVAW